MRCKPMTVPEFGCLLALKAKVGNPTLLIPRLHGGMAEAMRRKGLIVVYVDVGSGRDASLTKDGHAALRCPAAYGVTSGAVSRYLGRADRGGRYGYWLMRWLDQRPGR